MRRDKADILGSTARLKLLSCLKEKPRNVSELIRNCGLTQSAVSQHLAKLRLFKIVVSQKKGREVYYRLTTKSWGELAQQLLTYLEKL